MEDKKVYVFLADGFEEIEGLTVVDILRRGGVPVCMVSVSGDKTITGSHGIVLHSDLLFEETDFADAAMLVLPGGMPGTLHLKEHEGLAALLKKEVSKGTILAAICAAPTVLGGLGLLEGQKATCYPGLEDQLTGADVSKEPVVVSGSFITSRGMGTAIPFALKLLEVMKDAQTAERMGTAIVWNC